MKKLLLALTLFAAIVHFASCNSASSGDTVELKFKLPKGNKYEYAMSMEMKMNQEMMGKEVDMKNNMGFTYLFEVTNDSANWKTVSSTITKINMDMNANGKSMHFDTDMPAIDSGPAAIMGKVFGAMKGSQFLFTVNDKGDIGEVMGVKEMQDKMIASMPNDEGEGAAEGLSKAFDEESLKQNMQQAFSTYPGKPVKIGDSWTKTTTQKIQGMTIKSDNTYTLEAVNGNDATVKVSSKLNLDNSGQVNPAQMTMTGTTEGKTHYDLATGMTTDSDIDMKMDMKIKANNTEIPMSMNMKMKIKGKKI
jgi:hypothetical protein